MPKEVKIDTARLLLRSIRSDDAKEIYNYRSDSETNKYQGWILQTIEDVYDFIKNKVSPTIDTIGSWHQLVIIEKEEYKLIGDIGIHF